MPESGLEQKAGENFFGDLILYETNTFFSTAVGWFTGSVYNHCAIRISEDEAESPDLPEWIRSKNFLKHNLKHPEDYVISYKILRHKEITDEKRNLMMNFYQKVGREYDLPKIVRLARRILWRRKQDLTDITTDPDNDVVYHYSKMVVKAFGGKEKSMDNIGLMTENHFKMHECGSIYTFLLNLVGLEHGIENVHYSQIMPHQLENAKHDIVDIVEFKDKKHQFWARHNLLRELSRIRSDSSHIGIKTTKILSSFFNHKP